jgi:WD40 repeat protein
LLGKEVNIVDLYNDVVLEKINFPFSESPVYSISTNKVAYITTSNINTQSEACYVNVVDENGKLEFQYALRCGSAILKDRVRKIGVSNDGNLLVFHGKDLHLYIYDFRTGELKKSGSVTGQMEVIDFTADDKQIYMGNDYHGILRINVQSLEMESLFGGGTVRNLCFNSDTTAYYKLIGSSLTRTNIKRAISYLEVETELKLVKNYTQSDGILSIELIDYSQVRAITISNMQGKVLTSINTFTSNTTQIDLLSYPKGTYFITILTIDNQKQVLKIIH